MRGFVALLLMFAFVASCGEQRRQEAEERTVQPEPVGSPWARTEVEWMNASDGLALAKQERKPAIVVVKTEWCPHCKTYANVFRDPLVAGLSRRFVMILVDQDDEPAVQARWALDGEYIPRTVFVSPDGEPYRGITGPNRDARYFLDPVDSDAVAAAMKEAAIKAIKDRGGPLGRAARDAQDG